MKKANVEKLEHMAATYLQHKYTRYMYYRKEQGTDSRAATATWEQYVAACEMLTAFGARWNRYFLGNEDTDDRYDATLYEHQVKFPTDAQCEQLNLDAWVN